MIAFILAYLAFGGHTRRARKGQLDDWNQRPPHENAGALISTKAFSRLLLALNPAVGWQVIAGAGHGCGAHWCSGIPTRHTHLQMPASEPYDPDKFEACMKMEGPEIIAELDTRGIKYDHLETKEDFARLLAQSRSRGIADPSIINDFNKRNLERAFQAEDSDPEVKPDDLDKD